MKRELRELDRPIGRLESAKQRLTGGDLDAAHALVHEATFGILQPLGRKLHTKICEETRRPCPKCGNSPTTYGGTFNRHRDAEHRVCPMSYKEVA